MLSPTAETLSRCGVRQTCDNSCPHGTVLPEGVPLLTAEKVELQNGVGSQFPVRPSSSRRAAALAGWLAGVTPHAVERCGWAKEPFALHPASLLTLPHLPHLPHLPRLSGLPFPCGSCTRHADAGWDDAARGTGVCQPASVAQPCHAGFHHHGLGPTRCRLGKVRAGNPATACAAVPFCRPAFLPPCLSAALLLCLLPVSAVNI